MKSLIIPILLLAACSAEKANDEPPSFSETPSTRVPDLQCRIADGELHVSIMFSHGGSHFELCGSECNADRTNVKLRITSSPPGSVATAAFEQQEVRVPLEGTSGPIYLRLQQRVRDKEYVAEPEFVLAKIVKR